MGKRKPSVVLQKEEEPKAAVGGYVQLKYALADGTFVPQEVSYPATLSGRAMAGCTDPDNFKRYQTLLTLPGYAVLMKRISASDVQMQKRTL